MSTRRTVSFALVLHENTTAVQAAAKRLAPRHARAAGAFIRLDRNPPEVHIRKPAAVAVYDFEWQRMLGHELLHLLGEEHGEPGV